MALPPRIRLRAAVLFAVTLFLLAPDRARAQEPVPPVTITTLGGFLGYMDGQRADPGEMYGWTDKPKGGVLGAADWLTAHRKPGDILVLTANNLSHDSSGAKLREAVLGIGRPPASYPGHDHAALRADAVAFGIDDFLRALKQGNRAGALYDALRDPQAPPFVISNGIVRLSKSHLNVVDAGGFHLGVPENESVGWIDTLEVTCHPCPNVTATLEEKRAGHPDATIPVAITPDRTFRRLTLTLRPSLRPDAVYQLTLTPYGGRRSAVFSFRTHLALAPIAATSSDVPQPLRGLPVRYFTRPATVVTDAGTDSCKAPQSSAELPIVAIGMADPTSSSRSGDEMWNWEGGSCPAGICEIDFLPPLDALAAIKTWTAADSCAPPTTYLLLSGLTEIQMEPVITQNPDIRWIVIDYDSRALGQHRGRDGIINRSSPDTTQFWARPQWVGSSASTMTAALTWHRRPGDADRPSTWDMTAADVKTEIVAGKGLTWRLAPQVGRPPSIMYFPEGMPDIPIAGPVDVYPAFPGMLNARTSQGQLWTDTGEMAAFVLDIMRERGHADLAVLPAEFVDGDTMKWLADEYQTAGQPLTWLSRFVAERVFYRQEQIVTVDVAGSNLVAVVNGIIATEHRRFGDVYGAGFGTNAWLPSLGTTPMLNGRPLNPNHYYRVAMPQSVAEEQGLPSRHIVVTSLLDEMDRRMLKANGAKAATTGSLGEQLEEQFARRSRLYLSAIPARIDFAQEIVDEGNAGAFSNIPLEGRSAQAQEQWGFSGQAEVGLDYRGMAYRLTGEATFAKQTIANTITYPTDEWTAGFRIDWKLRHLGIQRLFGGLFRQSWFSDHVQSALTPVRTVPNAIDPAHGLALTDVQVAGPAITPQIQRPLFTFLRAGLDFEDSTLKALTLKGVAVSFDFGEVERDRDSVRIANGPVMDLDLMYRDGLGELLNRQFAADPAGFLSDPEVRFGYANHDQRRLQVDGGFEFAPARVVWTLTARYRKYFDESNRANFTPNESLLLKSQFEWRLFGRVKAGPFIDYYRVEAKGANGPFEDRKVGFGFEIPVHFAMRPGMWLR